MRGAGSRSSDVPELVVPFRREIYAAVAREFARFAADMSRRMTSSGGADWQ